MIERAMRNLRANSFRKRFLVYSVICTIMVVATIVTTAMIVLAPRFGFFNAIMSLVRTDFASTLLPGIAVAIAVGCFLGALVAWSLGRDENASRE